MKLAEDLNLISRFLARRDVASLTLEGLGEPIDVIALVGGSLIETVRVGAEAWKAGIAERILITGGIGHATEGLLENVRSQPQLSCIETVGRSEAEIMADVLAVEFGVKRDVMIL